jgi:hypothetical protein
MEATSTPIDHEEQQNGFSEENDSHVAVVPASDSRAGSMTQLYVHTIAL